MIFEELAKTTRDMQDLQRRINIQRNQDKQKAIDNRFRMLVFQLNNSIDAIEFIYNDMHINPDNEVITNTESILSILEESIEEGLAEKEKVDVADEEYKALQSELKKIWPMHFNQLTTFILGTLNVIRGIDSRKVSVCIHRIQVAKVWDNNLKKLQDMKLAIDEAEELIDGLGLNEEIKAFLEKIKNGKATLADVFSSDSKILNWIKKEKLESRIYVYLM